MFGVPAMSVGHIHPLPCTLPRLSFDVGNDKSASPPFTEDVPLFCCLFDGYIFFVIWRKKFKYVAHAAFYAPFLFFGLRFSVGLYNRKMESLLSNHRLKKSNLVVPPSLGVSVYQYHFSSFLLTKSKHIIVFSLLFTITFGSFPA